MTDGGGRLVYRQAQRSSRGSGIIVAELLDSNYDAGRHLFAIKGVNGGTREMSELQPSHFYVRYPMTKEFESKAGAYGVLVLEHNGKKSSPVGLWSEKYPNKFNDYGSRVSDLAVMTALEEVGVTDRKKRNPFINENDAKTMPLPEGGIKGELRMFNGDIIDVRLTGHNRFSLQMSAQTIRSLSADAPLPPTKDAPRETYELDRS